MAKAKTHVLIPDYVASEAQFASDRTCCVCQSRGLRVQIHHIDDNPSNNSLDNLAVLCLPCHDETQIRGGFARRLSAEVVRRYRRDWLERVAARRKEADRLLTQASTSAGGDDRVSDDRVSTKLAAAPEIPPRTGLVEYIRTLPELRRLAYQAARPGWDTGVTAEMVNASYAVIDSLVGALVALARYYPWGHFDRQDPRDYFSELVATRFRWHRYHNSPAGQYSGTIVGPLAASDVLRDIEQMIEDTVSSLTCYDEEFSYKSWLEEWRQASEER
jgi:hypothetical protein